MNCCIFTHPFNTQHTDFIEKFTLTFHVYVVSMRQIQNIITDFAFDIRSFTVFIYVSYVDSVNN